jgi:DNA-binding SARP family transcriptional activator
LKVLRHHHRHDDPPCAGERAALAAVQVTGVHVTLLGGFSVAIDGVPTEARGWAHRSAATLVKILALAPGHRLHRERVMDLLWPDEAPTRSAPRLHKAAHFARRATGHPDAIVLRDDIVSLFPEADVTVDAIRFEQLSGTAVALKDPTVAREALSWYAGELLPSDRYDDWAAERRELLHLRRLDVLRVVGEWRELAELDPTDESAHIELMRRHLDAGDGAAAVSQYEHLARVLDRELGVEPGDAARRARSEADRLDVSVEPGGVSPRVGALLVELVQLVNRQREVLADLATAGDSLPVLEALGA